MPSTGEVPSNEFCLDDVLRWRPPLPVGAVDLAPYKANISQGNLGEAGYAWEELAFAFLDQDVIQRSIGSKKPFIHIDLCSSLPIYVQAMRMSHFLFCAKQADAEILSSYNTMDTDLNQRITRSGAELILRSAIQKVMYQLNSEDIAFGNRHELYSSLRKRLGIVVADQVEVYELTGKPDVSNYPMKGVEFTVTTRPQTYMESIGQVIEGRTGLEAQSYVDEQLDIIARSMMTNRLYRPTRFVSFDLATPSDIARSSLENTPSSTRQTNLFYHAIASLFDRHQHLRGDITEPLQFPDDSIALLTCYDAWPLYISLRDLPAAKISVAEESVANVIAGWFNKLLYGGMLVVYPWQIKSAPSDSIKRIESRIMNKTGHGLTHEIFAAATLYGLMSEADREVAEHHSGITPLRNSPIKALTIKQNKRSASSKRFLYK